MFGFVVRFIRKKRLIKMLGTENSNKTDLDKKAKDVLIKMGHYNSIPIDIVSLTRQLGFTIQQMSLPDNITGILLVDDNKKILDTESYKLIIVDSELSYEKSRFITAHELAHYILHKKKASQFAHRDYKTIADSKEECEADTFARCLLMPKDLLLSELSEFNNAEKRKEDKVAFIAQKFCVSEKKAKARLEELGV